MSTTRYNTQIVLTIDHNILITRLSSGIGIHGSVLNWFKSYLSSRYFCVRCDKCLSSSYSCLCGVPVPKVLFLVPYLVPCVRFDVFIHWLCARYKLFLRLRLLFIMYTSPLSTLISSLSLNHHLYADDTQIFFSFYAPDFLSNITYLYNTSPRPRGWLQIS